jgi:hypothetical protein
MSLLDRWRSWLRRSFTALRPPVRQRPVLEELERRELPSAAPTFSVLPGFAESKWPTAAEAVRFQPLAQGDPLGLADAYRFGPLANGGTPAFQGGNMPGAHGGSPDAIPANAIAIDARWLARHGSGPYLLNQPGATYVLETNVDTRGTAFVVAAPNVTLDLNGHTVTYGDSNPVTVVNAGFEDGSGRNVPGWNLTQASSASLAPNTSFLFGNQVLRLSNFKTPQRISSDPIPITQVGHTYTATITPAGINAGSKVELAVLDARTGQVLGSGVSAAAFRGFSAVAQFTPRTSDPVILRIKVTPPKGATDSLDLDAATLTVSDDYGIVASDAPADGLPGLDNLSRAARKQYRKAANFTLENGSVEQGQGNGYASDPLFFRNLNGLTVKNVSTFASGMDTQSLDATYARGHVTVISSTFLENIANVSNRMNDNATLKLNDIRGPIQIENNQILGSPQIGIMLAQNDSHFKVDISGNYISQNAVVTNPYAILLSSAQNFEVANNTIAPISGRGIDVDGYSPLLLGHGDISNNYVVVQERLDRENPQGLPVEALRLRNNVDSEGPQRDLSIHGNTFIAQTAPGLVPEADSVRISCVNRGGQMTNAGVVLTHNLIKAVVNTTDPTYRAKALVLDRVDAGINLGIRNNVLESNDVSLDLTDTQGGLRGVTLVNNTVRQSADGAGRAYTPILAAFYSHEARNISILDTAVDNGAQPSVVTVGEGGVRNFTVTWQR